MDNLNHLSLLPVLLYGICSCLACHGPPRSRLFHTQTDKSCTMPIASRKHLRYPPRGPCSVPVPRRDGCDSEPGVCQKKPGTTSMPTLQPSAEWIARRSPPSIRDGSASGCRPEHPAPQAAAGAESEAAEGSQELGMLHPHDDGVVGHRGSGGLIRGRAVFCLPPRVEWFQGHVAYTTVGGCSASLGVLGTELPVDPVSWL